MGEVVVLPIIWFERGAPKQACRKTSAKGRIAARNGTIGDRAILTIPHKSGMNLALTPGIGGRIDLLSKRLSAA
jgi:hypothetical protein